MAANNSAHNDSNPQTLDEEDLADLGTDSLDSFFQEVEELTRDVSAPTEDPGPVIDEDQRLAEDRQAQWIAQGLQQSIEDLELVEPGSEAGEDENMPFFKVTVSDLSLAVRKDGVRAYLLAVDSEHDEDDVKGILEALHLAEPQTKGLRKYRQKSGKLRRWMLVAEGRSPGPGNPERIAYFYPGQPDKPLSSDTLSLMSVELAGLFEAQFIEEGLLPKIQAFSVVPGDILARGIPEDDGQPGVDVFGRSVPPRMETEQEFMEAGEHVSISPEGGYRAELYGYMSLLEGRLSVLPPLWVDPEKMKAYWVILDEGASPVTKEMMQQCLETTGIIEGINGTKINMLLGQINKGEHKRGMFLIAEGVPPTEGEDSQIEMLIDMERHPGKVLEDGSMDFREVNFTPNVHKGQRIARRSPPTKGTAGKNVLAQVLPARDGEDHPLQPGSNVYVEQEDESQVFYADIDGVVQRTKDQEELSVVELLQIRGDVSFNTGNLNFGGEVVIDGSVVQGFSVKAGGDITVTGTVEAGAIVVSKGNVTVAKGIVGRRTKVMAKEKVCAQFVQEATVVAGDDIELGNFAYHATLRAGGRLAIAHGKGRNGGSLMGGQTWAQQGIEVHHTGTKTHTPTLLVAGLSSEQAQKLDKIRENIDITYQHMMKILRRFNLESVDVGQIRNMIAAATGPRQRILAQSARDLGQLTHIHQKLLAAQQSLLDHLGNITQNAEIVVRDTVFSGTEVRLGEYRLKITDETKGARFHIQDDKLARA